MTNDWTRLTIGGKIADVYDPTGPIRPRFGILYLHGAGLETLVDKPAFTRLFDELNVACVCPHGQRSWWGDRICAEFDLRLTPDRYLLDTILPFFCRGWQLAPPAIGLQGIGMGGQGALRLAFKYPRLFPVVAAIAPALDFHELYGQGTALDDMYHSREQCRQDTAILHIQANEFPVRIFFCIDPEDAQWYRGNDRLHEKLTALAIPHEIDFTTQAGGHSWDYFNRMAERVVRFVHAGLLHESRRLL